MLIIDKGLPVNKQKCTSMQYECLGVALQRLSLVEIGLLKTNAPINAFG